MEAMTTIAGQPKRRVCYFFDNEIGNYHYAQQHPMKPHRIKMTHTLVMNYGLYRKMEIFRAKPATKKEMAQFHTDEYVEFLNRITPENMDNYAREQAKFNVGDDCPVFEGLFDYCSISAGGSMEGAARLSRDKCDIAVNWAGGLHHAKKAEASGFCYVNDIVLGILELLRYHQRVLYIDIDVHHGDGVEEAFYTTDRVMTCSFHKYGEFFPGTGEFRDIGHGKGKYYSVNVPLRDGITDESYKGVFEPVIDKIMEWYQPGAIVLQCGTDSLSGDRLGPFNLSMRGHANCVNYIKSFNLPLLLLGGGGYTIRNVSRTWAYETGLAAGVELGAQIPMNEYYEYFGPTYNLDVPASNQEDMNTREYLDKIKTHIFENLRHTAFAPSVQQTAIPQLPRDNIEADEDLDDPDERKPQRQADASISRDDEFDDSDDEEGPTSKKGIEVNGNAHQAADPHPASSIATPLGSASPVVVSSVPEPAPAPSDSPAPVELPASQPQPEAPAVNGDAPATPILATPAPATPAPGSLSAPLTAIAPDVNGSATEPVLSLSAPLTAIAPDVNGSATEPALALSAPATSVPTELAPVPSPADADAGSRLVLAGDVPDVEMEDA